MLSPVNYGSYMFIALLAWTNSAQAVIYPLNNEVLPTDLLKYRLESMYSMYDSPYIDGPNAKAFVKVDVEFVRQDEDYPNQDTGVEVVFVNSDNLDKVGVLGDNGERLYCCSAALVAKGVCKKPYSLIVDEDQEAGTYVASVTFEDVGDGITGVETLVETFPVHKKGTYFLMFSSCNELTGTVIMNGHTIWKNPYGYLPGGQYELFVFFGHISLTYVLIMLVWGYFCFKNWRDLLVLQNYITMVVILGMFEISLRYFDLDAFNINGVRTMGLMVMAVIFNSARKVVARMLVLVACMGYGVVRPSLGDTLFKVMCLGGLYFVFSAVQGVVANASHSHAIGFPQYMLQLPVAVLDVFFYYWIFLSLKATMQQLEDRKQQVKLTLFKRFRIVLICSVAASVFWSIYYTVIHSTDKLHKSWEMTWILEGFWEVLYLAVFVSIMVLWRPSVNSQRYSYQQVMSYDADEEYESDLEDPVAQKDRAGSGYGEGNDIAQELDLLPPATKQT